MTASFVALDTTRNVRVMKNRKVIIACGATVAAAVVGLGILGAASPSSTSDGQITYTVDGADTNANSVTYSTDQGQSQLNGVGLPWSVTVKIDSVASIVAQADASAYQSITCTITQGGKVIATQTSYGAAAVVTCAAHT